MNNNPVSEDKNNISMRQIRLDIGRTFRAWNLKFLHADVASGRNKLYNLLKVYCLLLDSELGYCQGMNMVAAVVLMNVPNEVLACQIFMRILERDHWA